MARCSILLCFSKTQIFSWQSQFSNRIWCLFVRRDTDFSSPACCIISLGMGPKFVNICCTPCHSPVEAPQTTYHHPFFLQSSTCGFLGKNLVSSLEAGQQKQKSPVTHNNTYTNAYGHKHKTPIWSKIYGIPFSCDDNYLNCLVKLLFPFPSCFNILFFLLPKRVFFVHNSSKQLHQKPNRPLQKQKKIGSGKASSNGANEMAKRCNVYRCFVCLQFATPAPLPPCWQLLSHSLAWKTPSRLSSERKRNTEPSTTCVATYFSRMPQLGSILQ